MSVTILVLIAKIILLILAGQKAFDAVDEVARESGTSFSTLWEKLPNEYK